MAADENKVQQDQPRRYKALHVVADTLERDEHLTIGVLVDGALIPLVTHPLGYVESQKERWSNSGGTHAEAAAETNVQELQTRVANLERAAIAAGMQLDQPAPPANEPAQ